MHILARLSKKRVVLQKSKELKTQATLLHKKKKKKKQKKKNWVALHKSGELKVQATLLYMNTDCLTKVR